MIGCNIVLHKKSQSAMAARHITKLMLNNTAEMKKKNITIQTGFV